MRALLPALLAAAACGGSWTAADAKGAADAVRAEALIEQMCAEGARCPPPQVRALERAALCNNASMLARHGDPVPATETQCPTK